MDESKFEHNMYFKQNGKLRHVVWNTDHDSIGLAILEVQVIIDTTPELQRDGAILVLVK